MYFFYIQIKIQTKFINSFQIKEFKNDYKMSKANALIKL